mmetsp:Transcript_751/g.1869  ORF Transcript_751/g.1869 Transcript_751/m.1869 type:complete len:205 (+) Transcript_751:2023-2637(+)
MERLMCHCPCLSASLLFPLHPNHCKGMSLRALMEVLLMQKLALCQVWGLSCPTCRWERMLATPFWIQLLHSSPRNNSSSSSSSSRQWQPRTRKAGARRMCLPNWKPSSKGRRPRASPLPHLQPPISSKTHTSPRWGSSCPPGPSRSSPSLSLTIQDTQLPQGRQGATPNRTDHLHLRRCPPANSSWRCARQCPSWCSAQRSSTC